MNENTIEQLLFQNKKNNKNIYIMGCGGISMTIIADYLLKNNYKIKGVDTNLFKVIHKNQYIELFNISKETNIENCDLLIVSHFFIDGNYPEIIQAKQLNIPIILRIDFIKYLAHKVKNNHQLVSIMGSVGKTTTTYFGFTLSKLLGNNPSILGGSYLPSIGNNYFLGQGDVFLENDESRDEHLHIVADVLILTGLFHDHLEEKCYDNNFEKLIKYNTKIISLGLFNKWSINNHSKFLNKAKIYVLNIFIVLNKQLPPEIIYIILEMINQNDMLK